MTDQAAETKPAAALAAGRPEAPASRPAPPIRSDVVDDYRSVSVLAVAGLLLGLASISAWLHPLLWLVPLAAVVVSLLAFRKLALDAPNLIGWKPAAVGLALGLLCGAGAATRWALHQYLVEAEAAKVGVAWIDLVRDGRDRQVHQLSLLPIARLTAPDIEAAYGELPDLEKEFQEFDSIAVIQRIHETPQDAQIRLYRVTDHHRVKQRDRLGTQFEVSYDKDGRRQGILVELIMHRLVDGKTGEVTWQIIPVAEPKPLDAAG